VFYGPKPPFWVKWCGQISVLWVQTSLLSETSFHSEGRFGTIKQLSDHIISLRREVWAHKTLIWPHYFTKKGGLGPKNTYLIASFHSKGRFGPVFYRSKPPFWVTWCGQISVLWVQTPLLSEMMRSDKCFDRIISLRREVWAQKTLIWSHHFTQKGGLDP
jgi:intracellular septation protein A